MKTRSAGNVYNHYILIISKTPEREWWGKGGGGGLSAEPLLQPSLQDTGGCHNDDTHPHTHSYTLTPVTDAPFMHCYMHLLNTHIYTHTRAFSVTMIISCMIPSIFPSNLCVYIYMKVFGVEKHDINHAPSISAPLQLTARFVNSSELISSGVHVCVCVCVCGGCVCVCVNVCVNG